MRSKIQRKKVEIAELKEKVDKMQEYMDKMKKTRYEERKQAAANKEFVTHLMRSMNENFDIAENYCDYTMEKIIEMKKHWIAHFDHQMENLRRIVIEH